MPNVPTDLFRSCKRSNYKGNEAQKAKRFTDGHGVGSLYPDYEGFTRKDGSIRAPDVTSYKDRQDNWWIEGVDETDGAGKARVSWKEGVSVSTARGGFGYDNWFYFLLPQDTPVPAGLDVVPTPTNNDPGHHSIRCKNRMRQDAYEGALDNLARAAIAKAVEDNKQSLYFS